MHQPFGKKALHFLAITLMMTFIAFICAACGNEEGPAEGQVEITFWGSNSQYNTAQYKDLVDTYNKGQGLLDGVYVVYSPKGGDYSSSLSTILRGRNAPNVCLVGDKYFKAFAAQGLLANLEPYLADPSTYTRNAEGELNFDLSDIYENNVYRYRYDKEHNTAGSDDSPLYALPNGSVPTIVMYNEDFFQEAGINIISVAEEDLEAYNTANSTSFKPHGYAEYAVAATPQAGLTVSENLQGEKVIKVFNNQIPMNWTELVTLSRQFTKAYNPASPSFYGFLSEWWFPYGWSVGGDCIQWDEKNNKYVFSLGDETSNYLVTKTAVINGHNYGAGEILSYNDAKTVEAKYTSLVQDGTLYEIPSQYEAFSEFCALYQVKNQNVDSKGKLGYGIAPNPTEVGSNRTTYFTSGKSAMLIEQFSQANIVARNLDDKWGFAPAWQYREYDCGDVAGSLNGSSGTLKIIGKSYDGVVYTGDIKKVNGTEIVGYQEASSLNTGIAISEKSSAEKKAASWKFVQFLAGKAGQKILGTANDIIPNQISYINSQDYQANSLFANNNIKAGRQTSIVYGKGNNG